MVHTERGRSGLYSILKHWYGPDIALLMLALDSRFLLDDDGTASVLGSCGRALNVRVRRAIDSGLIAYDRGRRGAFIVLSFEGEQALFQAHRTLTASRDRSLPARAAA